MTVLAVIRLPGEGRNWVIQTPAGPLRVEGLRRLDRAEATLLGCLPPMEGRVVIPGVGGSPLVPAAVAAANPDSAVDLVEPDLHDVRLLSARLAPFANARVLCAADAPASDDVRQTGLLLWSERTDRLLAFDQIERLDHILSTDSLVIALAPASRAADLARKVERHLRRLQVLHRDDRCVVWRGLSGGDREAWTPRMAVFEATTAAARVRLCSRPGVFSHGRPDAGGLAVAECAEVSPGMRLLDLGSGCGLTGLLLAARTAGDLDAVLVDSSARAVECAARGAAMNGFGRARVLLSDLEDPLPGPFDVVTANPPYYADHRIAERFMDAARATLRPGGILWLVSKHGGTMARLAGRRGFGVQSLRRRGFDITRAEIAR